MTLWTTIHGHPLTTAKAGDALRAPRPQTPPRPLTYRPVQATTTVLDVHQVADAPDALPRPQVEDLSAVLVTYQQWPEDVSISPTLDLVAHWIDRRGNTIARLPLTRDQALAYRTWRKATGR